MSNSENESGKRGCERPTDQSVVLGRDPLVWNSLGLVYLMSGDVGHALEAIQKSLEIDTSVSSTWALWGRLLETRCKYLDAERAYRMCIELEPDNVRARHRMALLRLRRHDPIGALEDLVTILEITPSDQTIWDCVTECTSALVM